MVTGALYNVKEVYMPWLLEGICMYLKGITSLTFVHSCCRNGSITESHLQTKVVFSHIW